MRIKIDEVIFGKKLTSIKLPCVIKEAVNSSVCHLALLREKDGIREYMDLDDEDGENIIIDKDGYILNNVEAYKIIQIMSYDEILKNASPSLGDDSKAILLLTSQPQCKNIETSTTNIIYKKMLYKLDIAYEEELLSENENKNDNQRKRGI